ncbi:MAG: M24 family metallopeptidase, partial [Alphaproteobacteria bacterium]
MTMTDFIDAADAPLRNTGQIKLHGPEAFEGMRKAGRISAECLDMLIPHVVPGVSTSRLDDLAREYLLDNGSTPACLFYKGYRHTVCTSVNHVVCHGIPGPKLLKEGDIVNIDVTGIVDGWHGDTSRMYAVGETPRKAMRLMDVTY